MKRYPSIPLLLLAVLTLGLGLLVEHKAAPRPVMPAILQFRSYLVLAAVIVLGAVIAGLFRQPVREFPRYDWPGYISTRSAVNVFLFAAVVLAFGLLISSRGPTCGSVRMHVGDRCLSGGTTSSYNDVNSAPVRQLWIYLVIALAVISYGIVQLVRRRQPTREELKAFEANVAANRQFLIKKHNQLAALGSVSPAALPARLAKFDEDVRAERERVGLRASRPK